MAFQVEPDFSIEGSSFFVSPECLEVDQGNADFLGKGAFGKVLRCYQRDREGSVAVKMFDLTGSKEGVMQTVKEAMREMDMMVYLQASPNVVTLIGVTLVEDCMLGLIMEHLPRGTLSDLVIRRNIEWPLALRMMYETASGLSYLHKVRFEKRITHNDIKPDNILFDYNFRAKICDFGGSNLALHSSKKVSRTQGTDSNVYSINYVAPEYITSSSERRTRAMDVYSFGMILYFMLARKPAFFNYDSGTIMHFLKCGEKPKLNRRLITSPAVEPDVIIIELMMSQMDKCSSKSPEQRPTMEEVENNLKNELDGIKKSDLDEIVRKLIAEVPIPLESALEKRVTLRKKCGSLFVKKLEIPYDDFHYEGDTTPLIPKSTSAKYVKATISSTRKACHTFVEETANISLKNVARSVKTVSTALNNVMVIQIPEEIEALHKGDKFIIQSKSKVFNCYVAHAYKEDDSQYLCGRQQYQ